jgi:predicted kinase
MKKLIILRGIPGSGKSTYANKLKEFYIKENKTIAHWEADMFFTKPDGSYDWKPNLVGVAHKWCQDKVRNSLDNCDVVIVSNTSLTESEVNTYVQIGETAGAEISIYRLIGNYQNVHGVPEETLEKMKAKLQDYPGEHFVS